MKHPKFAMALLLTLLFSCVVVLCSCDSLKGPQGEQGIQGQQGEQGPQGEQGEKGEAGASAYEIFCEKNNYQGTLDEWLQHILCQRLNLRQPKFINSLLMRL